MGFGKQILNSLKDGLAGAIGGIPGMAIGFGTSALQGLMGNAFERKSLDYQAQLNEQSALNAYGRQLDFWNRQNEYNSPAAQVARLRAAGLNPAMLNGNGVNNTAGALSSTPQASPGSPGGNKPNAASDAAALANFAYQVKQMGFLDQQTKESMERILSIQVERGIKALEEQLKLTDSEKARLDYTAFYEAYYGKSIDGGEPTIKNNPYSEQIREARSRILLNEANEKLAKADTEMKEAQKKYTDTMERIANEQSEAQKKVLEEQAKSYAASAAASYANAILAKVNADYTQSQKDHFEDKREIDLEIMRAARDAGVSEAQIKKWEAERTRIRTNGPSRNSVGEYIKESLQFLVFNLPLVY